MEGVDLCRKDISSLFSMFLRSTGVASWRRNGATAPLPIGLLHVTRYRPPSCCALSLAAPACCAPTTAIGPCLFQSHATPLGVCVQQEKKACFPPWLCLLLGLNQGLSFWVERNCGPASYKQSKGLTFVHKVKLK